MAGTDHTPIEAIALDVARADMHYVTTSLIGLPSAAAAAEVALLQYGAMAAYEAQVHFEKTLGWRLFAEWNADTAKAARMAGKFFADTERNLDGVVIHFEQLLRANHGAFFPGRRRGRIFDFLRDDLSVVTLDAMPYTSLVSAHYLTGLEPDQTGDLETVGPAIARLSVGVGNVAGQLLAGSDVDAHQHGPVPPFEWFDGRSEVALPRLFGGELNPSLAAALLTVQSSSSSAVQSVSRSLCDWCEAAARKHRFVSLFQSMRTLELMRRNDITASGSREMTEFLEEPESIFMLKQAKLRNGLVHLGLQDIAPGLGSGSTIHDAVRAYTSEDPDAFASRVLRHLTRLNSILTTWLLTPTADGHSFLTALHPAPLTRPRENILS